MSAPAFVDAAYAAQMLHVTPDAVLELMRNGTLRRYGGRPDNPFFRTADVLALAHEVGPQPEAEEAPRRVKSASARVQTRLTADARWADVSDEDLREWAARADPARRKAGRKAVAVSREKLEALVRILDELER